MNRPLNTGTYTVTWSLKDTGNTTWSDNSTGNKSANWSINWVNGQSHYSNDIYNRGWGRYPAGSSLMTVQNDTANGYLICTDLKDHYYTGSVTSATSKLSVEKRNIKVDGYIAKYTASGTMGIGMNTPGTFYNVHSSTGIPLDDEYMVLVNHQGQSFTAQLPANEIRSNTMYIIYSNPIKCKWSGHDYGSESHPMGHGDKGTIIHITRIYYDD